MSAAGPDRQQWLADRVRSFGRAVSGLRHALGTEVHLRVHAVATLVVFGAAAGLQVSRVDWCLLLLTCAAVWSAELLNTGLERLADAVHPDMHPLVGRAKDVAAGGVLVTVIAAVAVGVLVLSPYVLELVSPAS